MFLFAPFVTGQKAWAMWLELHFGDLAGRLMNPTELLPPTGRADWGNSGTRWLLSGELPRGQEGFCDFPPFSVSSFSLSFRNFLFSLQLSGMSNCSLYTRIFEFAHRRDRVQRPATPPSWTSTSSIFSKVFSISEVMNFTKGKDSFF